MPTWWEATSTVALSPACNSFFAQPGGSMPLRRKASTCARRPPPRAAAFTACVAIGQPKMRSDAIKDFEHSEVIVRGCTSHEGLYLAQHALDVGAFDRGFQPFFPKKFAVATLRFGNAIG